MNRLVWIIAAMALAPAYGAAAQDLEAFSDCDVCPEIVILPSGSFHMGSDADDMVEQYPINAMRGIAGMPDFDPGKPFVEGGLGGGPEETPRHEVRFVAGFGIGRHEVTVAQYRAFLDDSGHAQTPGCFTFEHDPDATDQADQYRMRDDRSFLSPGYTQSDEHPAVCVSRADAESYVAWLSSRTARSYRLPTEAEWEYAARSGSTGAYFFGSDPTQLCDYANFADSGSPFAQGLLACDDGYPSTPAPVGSFKPNAFGLHDMHGNVFEPVLDCWHGTYDGAPADGTAWGKACSSENIVLRSYSFESFYPLVRSASRCAAGEHLGKSNMAGFRVALSLDN